MPSISVVIPAYNEAARIGGSVERVGNYLARFPSKTELIVVDDGSADRTAEVVERLHVPGLRLLRNEQNRGKGYSVKRGVLSASGDYVLFSDADLSAPIEELDKLLEVALREDADVVVGSRAVNRRLIEKHQSRFRELGGILFNRMVRVLLGLNIRDTQCGFKLFRRSTVAPVFEAQTTDGFGFDPELLFIAARRKLKICEVPVRWSHAEGSKVRFARDATRMFADLLRIRWNQLTGRYS